jgi:excisionase family DNA binding protein
VRLEVELTDAQLATIAECVAELVVAREERWLTPKELADHLSCSVRTISNYHRAGMPHLMVGSHPRYRASDVEAWLARYSVRRTNHDGQRRTREQ